MARLVETAGRGTVVCFRIETYSLAVENATAALQVTAEPFA
jgi:hypothetical protein